MVRGRPRKNPREEQETEGGNKFDPRKQSRAWCFTWMLRLRNTSGDGEVVPATANPNDASNAQGMTSFAPMVKYGEEHADWRDYWWMPEHFEEFLELCQRWDNSDPLVVQPQTGGGSKTVPHITYCVMQLEMCPKTRRVHLQGYLETDTERAPTRLLPLKELVFKDTRVHLEPRFGDQEQAANYCKKSETSITGPGTCRWEFGDARLSTHSGSRLAQAVRMVREGKAPMDLGPEFDSTNARYHAFLDKVRQKFMFETTQRMRDVVVIVLTGPTGSGKSMVARSLFDHIYNVPLNAEQQTLWFDNYQPLRDKAVLFDDYNGHVRDVTAFLRMLDRYAIQVQVKGAHIPLFANYFVITSNRKPEQWYPTIASEHMDALRRRITFEIEVDPVRNPNLIQQLRELTMYVRNKDERDAAREQMYHRWKEEAPLRMAKAKEIEETCNTIWKEYLSGLRTTSGKLREWVLRQLDAGLPIEDAPEYATAVEVREAEMAQMFEQRMARLSGASQDEEGDMSNGSPIQGSIMAEIMETELMKEAAAEHDQGYEEWQEFFVR